jgi:uncharacterized membrane protein (DUF373 family)
MKSDDKFSLSKFFRVKQEEWALMSFYERFEQAVAIALSIVISLIVLLALFQLVKEVFLILFIRAQDPLEHQVFQAVFGMIMTLLIAMEFKHSIIRVALRQDSIIQVKTVILIAILAISRKFIIIDMATTTPAKLAALSGAVLVLGVVYWLMRERDDYREIMQEVEEEILQTEQDRTS